MNPEPLEHILIEPEGPAQASLVWLHGLGADGHDFEPLIPELGVVERGVRVILPHAPVRPVTINGGMRMRAWYDIRLPDLTRAVDEAGILDSVARIEALVAAEQAAGIPAARILLAGFSQGGAIALQLALERVEPLGGVLALSTYLPLPQRLVPGRVQTATPVFQAHGSEDTIVPPALAERCVAELRALGVAVEFHRYRMAHAVCPDEIADIRDWIARHLPAD